MPEVEALLRKEVEGVDKVFFINWRVWYLLQTYMTNLKLTWYKSRNTLPEATEGVIDLNDLTS